MARCRICLCSKPRKDISELNITQNGEKQASKHVIMFCLGIQISDDPNTNTKLCVKCYRKIIEFYDFKVLAVRNDESMRELFANTLAPENGIFFLDNDVKVEPEDNHSEIDNLEEPLVFNKDEISYDDAIDTDDIKYELKQEVESEDVVLSVIKHLKDQAVLDINKKAPARKRVKLKKIKSILTTEELKEKKRRQKGHIPGICEECGKEVKDLRAHKKTHIIIEKQPNIKCEYCDKVFKSNVYKRKHVQRKHLSVKQDCNLCGKSVLDLKMHTKVMHMQESLQFECVHCKRKFLTQARLKAHVIIHTKDRPFECDVCGACFRQKLTLSNHKRQVHDKERPHTCHLCSKSFFKKDHLKIHLRKHTNEKPYECPECGKFLQSSTILKNHRLRHSSVKNVKCTLCDATFYTKSHLSNHMVSHLKEKRYPCRFCEAKFHRSDHRKRHEFTAHFKHGGAGAAAGTVPYTLS